MEDSREIQKFENCCIHKKIAKKQYDCIITFTDH